MYRFYVLIATFGLAKAEFEMSNTNSPIVAKPKKKRRKRVTLIVFTVIFFGLAVFGFAAGYVNPYNSPYCEYLQLALPFILAGNAIVLICWLFGLRWIALLPVIALAMNYGYISGVVQFPHSNDVEPDIRIMTYNVRCFNSGESLYAVADFLNNQNIDVACLQEFEIDKGIDPDQVFASYPFTVFNSEYAILSKYPIEQSDLVKFVNNGHGALLAVINVGGKRLNFVNSHLQTTGLSLSKKKYDREGRISLERAEGNFTYNSKMRAAQSEELRKIIDDSNKPVIFCGDLNDVPSSYAYHKVKGGLQDTFRNAGKGYCYSYRNLFKLFRIDYILTSNSIRAASYESPDLDFSDHKPVIVSLDI
jgi:endonuclease/exonuclease/phosphatase (EEP) superfamily protein YafD